MTRSKTNRPHIKIVSDFAYSKDKTPEIHSEGFVLSQQTRRIIHAEHSHSEYIMFQYR